MAICLPITVCALIVLMGVWKHDVLLRLVWNYLVVNENPQPADIIIVLSGGRFERVEYGVKLYQEGYAEKLLISGGSSQNLKQRALSLGVPEDHILIENRSSTTFENAKYSAEMMKAYGLKSAIIVTSPYHTHRADIIFKQFFKPGNFTMCAVPYDTSIATNWWRDGDSTRNVITEYMKLVYHYVFER